MNRRISCVVAGMLLSLAALVLGSIAMLTIDERTKAVWVLWALAAGIVGLFLLLVSLVAP